MSAISTLGRIVLVGGLAVAALAWPLAKWAESSLGTTAILLATAADDGTVELQREQFDDTEKDAAKRRAAVIGIYGNAPTTEPDRFLGVTDADLIRPVEDRSLTLLRPKAGGWRQSKSFGFAAPRVIALALAAAVLGFLLMRRRGAGG